VGRVIAELAKTLDCTPSALAMAVDYQLAGHINTSNDLDAVFLETQNNSGGQDVEQDSKKTSSESIDPDSSTITDVSNRHAAQAVPPLSPGLEKLAQSISNRQKINAAASELPGMPGVSVVRGLVPRPPKTTNAKSEAPLTQQELALLEQFGSLGIASDVLARSLEKLATTAGISSLVVKSSAPCLFYGYYMELPKQGELGSSFEDIALQAWWILSSFSQQFNPAITELLLNDQEGAPPALEDRGPSGFKQALSHADLFEKIIATSLGGAFPNVFELIHELLTNRRHPLHMHLLAFLDACTNWRDVKAQGGNA